MRSAPPVGPGPPPAPAGPESAGRCPGPGRRAACARPPRRPGRRRRAWSSGRARCPRARAPPRRCRGRRGRRAARRPAATGVVTAKRSGCVAGQGDAGGAVDRLHQRSAVPGVRARRPRGVGLAERFIAALTADTVSAGRTSSDVGWRGSWATPALRSPARGGHRHQTAGQAGRRVLELRRRRRHDPGRGQLVDVGLPVGRRPGVDVDLFLLQLRQLLVHVAQRGVELVGDGGRLLPRARRPAPRPGPGASCASARAALAFCCTSSADRRIVSAAPITWAAWASTTSRKPIADRTSPGSPPESSRVSGVSATAVAVQRRRVTGDDLLVAGQRLGVVEDLPRVGDGLLAPVMRVAGGDHLALLRRSPTAPRPPASAARPAPGCPALRRTAGLIAGIGHRRAASGQDERGQPRGDSAGRPRVRHDERGTSDHLCVRGASRTRRPRVLMVT